MTENDDAQRPKQPGDEVLFDKMVSLDKTDDLRVRFTRSARKHKIGKSSAWQAIAIAGHPKSLGNGRLLWIGVDARGRELEIVGRLGKHEDDVLLIVHVMPTAFRKEGYWDEP